VGTTTTTHNLSTLQQPGSLKNVLVLPKTVADAIVLTRKLGIHYLWVDCLSVVQNSPEKHQDIANMDIIYSQATLTIIASGSENADSGLPGVRQGTRRKRVTSVSHGSHATVLRLSTRKQDLLEGTTYYSRAWTFQELVLSKRTLFITEQQAVFQCGASKCSESLPHEQAYELQEYGYGPIDLRWKRNVESDSKVIAECYSTIVAEYSSKVLSFQADIENALSGLNSIVEQWSGGCPVTHGLLPQFLGYSLFWKFGSVQQHNNFNTVENRGNRRKDFPSWSWTGWVTSIDNFCSNEIMYLPLTSTMRDITINMWMANSEARILTVTDRSAIEHDGATSVGQQIQIKIEAAPAEKTLRLPDTLCFNAERISCKNMFVEASGELDCDFPFSMRGQSQPCGYLCLPPKPAIIRAVRKYIVTKAVKEEIDEEIDEDWSLVQLHQCRLRPIDKNFDDEVQLFLDAMQDCHSIPSSRVFRGMLEESELLHVLLIRRSGIYWERFGSGLMIKEHWPSTEPGAGISAHLERIVLI
jgi:hypothetical protein